MQTLPAININVENGSWARYQQAWAQADSQVATGMISLKDAKGTVCPQPSIPQAHRWPKPPVSDRNGLTGSVRLSPAGWCEDTFPRRDSGTNLAGSWGCVKKQSRPHCKFGTQRLASSAARPECQTSLALHRKALCAITEPQRNTRTRDSVYVGWYSIP